MLLFFCVSIVVLMLSRGTLCQLMLAEAGHGRLFIFVCPPRHSAFWCHHVHFRKPPYKGGLCQYMLPCKQVVTILVIPYQDILLELFLLIKGLVQLTILSILEVMLLLSLEIFHEVQKEVILRVEHIITPPGAIVIAEKESDLCKLPIKQDNIQQ